jgi:hypothetical protein
MSDIQLQSREHLARYLDRIRSAYPYGVPSSAIRVGAASDVPLDKPPKVSFLVVQPQEAFSSEQDALLDSVVTKGLRLSVEQTFRRVVMDDVELQGAIVEQSALQGVIVVLGAARQDGILEQFGGSYVVYSHALSDISGQPPVKKAFWGHLQAVLGRLS